MQRGAYGLHLVVGNVLYIRCNTKTKADQLATDLLTTHHLLLTKQVVSAFGLHFFFAHTVSQYDPDIRRLIYTTNTIEGFHRQVRKVTKTKGAFPSDITLLKLIYLAYLNIRRKWTQPLKNWCLTLSQLAIRFSGRLNLTI